MHGLNYIGSTTKLIRVAWIVIVLSGFSFAGYLIWQSFDNWNQNPVDTTISTHPIEQVTFPKIYVCPPKHTYTNLNYDIEKTKKVFLSEDHTQELKVLVDDLTLTAEIEERMADIIR